MVAHLAKSLGNPSAIHAEGRAQKAVVSEARESVARVLRVRPSGVVFTSGGTESNVLALVGYLKHLHQSTGRTYTEMEVISTALEHPSLRNTLASLEARGVTVTTVPVTSEGLITPAALERVLSPRTVLCSFAYANSEIGTVQPVHALARVLRAYERAHSFNRIMLHLDAAQAPLWLPCDLPRLDVDLLTLDGGKCGGPLGSGLLAMRKDVAVLPILFGGGQEGGRRPGTENVVGIVGVSTALILAQKSWHERSEAVASVRDYGIRELATRLPTAVLNGPVGKNRIANNINISLPGVDTEYAVIVLDSAGVAASTKSACAGAGGGESAVVMATTGDAARARSTLRLTLGPETTAADLTYVVTVLAKHLHMMDELTQ
jgi:cysteine desulfurase